MRKRRRYARARNAQELQGLLSCMGSYGCSTYLST